jgi:cell wall-associated NlpC family hydrolase
LPAPKVRRSGSGSPAASAAAGHRSQTSITGAEIPLPRRWLKAMICPLTSTKRRASAAPHPYGVPERQSAPRPETTTRVVPRAAANLALGRRRSAHQRIRRGFRCSGLMKRTYSRMDKDARRNMARLIKVSKGTRSDIRIG